MKAGNRERSLVAPKLKMKAKQRDCYVRPSQMDDGKITMLMRQKIYRRRFHKCNNKKRGA